MTLRRMFLVAAVGALASVVVETGRPRGVEAQGASVPSAISGSPSSARQCIAGQAANVHSLGWVEAGNRYTVTFESDITFSAALLRLSLDSRQLFTAYGTSDLTITATTSGNVVLVVSGNGRSGCYKYKAQLDRPAASVAAGTPRSRPSPVTLEPAKNPIQTRAITGFASSAKHCVAGDAMTKVHGIGRIDQDTVVTISFDSDFNPIAAAAVTDLAAQRSVWYLDDDSGGDGEPRLRFTASQGGNVTLFVGGMNGSAGCYRYKVELTLPSSPTPSPTPAPAPGPSPAPSPSPAPGGKRTFKAVWLNASWLGGRKGPPLNSRGVDPVPGTVFGTLCPANSVTLENHPPSREGDLLDHSLFGRTTCSISIREVAVCRSAGGGSAGPPPVCAVDPRQSSNFSLRSIGRSGVSLLAQGTAEALDVNLLWCSDRSHFNLGEIRGVSPLDCVEN